MASIQIRRLAAIAATSTIALTLAACSSGQGSTSPAASSGPKAGTLNIVYIQKQGDQPYFVDEAAGAKAEAERLGDVNLTMVNVGTNSNAAITAVNTAIAQGQVPGSGVTVFPSFMR